MSHYVVNCVINASGKKEEGKNKDPHTEPKFLMSGLLCAHEILKNERSTGHLKRLMGMGMDMKLCGVQLDEPLSF